MRFVRVAAPLVMLMVCSDPSCALPQNAGKAATPPPFGQNLLKNSGAEAATNDAKKVPGWPQLLGFEVATYGGVAGEWDWGVSGCSTCGKQYLRLAFEGETKLLSVSQTVDVSFAAQDIDLGKVTSRIAGQLGGFVGADTTAQLTVSFQDANHKELGVLATDPYDSAKLPKPTVGSANLIPVEKSGRVPPGTRAIAFMWKATAVGDSGSYIALADNLSLSLTVDKQ